jgi:hypothetical protein
VTRVGLFLAGSLLLWAVLAYPAYLLGGEQALVFSATALGLCLVPALVTMFGVERAFRKAPEQYLILVLGSTGLRMFVVLGAALVVNNLVEYFQKRSFFLWVLALYLLLLALETVLLLAGRTSPGKS